MVDLLAPLHRHFGHTSFRAGQEDLVRAVLDGRDVLAVMPTGSARPAELRAVPGIGSAKLTAYGDAILAVVASVLVTAKT